MPIDLVKFRAFKESLGFVLNYEDGQVLLIAMLDFATAHKDKFSKQDKDKFNAAFKIIKTIADQEHDQFWTDFDKMQKDATL